MITAMVMLWVGDHSAKVQWTLTVVVLGGWWACAAAVRAAGAVARAVGGVAPAVWAPVVVVRPVP